MAKYENVKEMVAKMPDNAEFHMEIWYPEHGIVTMESANFGNAKRWEKKSEDKNGT